MANTYHRPYPHDPIKEIADDIFMVRGTNPLNAVMRISRNMAIVRSGSDLTLINPVRLSKKEEKRLHSLGKVKHVLRLGAFHGVDDPYYVDTYQATFWSQQGGTTYQEPAIDYELSEGGDLPFGDASFFSFKGTTQPEGYILLHKGSGLLLTCDGIQHYGDYRHNNLPARLLMPFIGFPRRMIVGPVWLKGMTPEGGSLLSEFEKILSLNFDALLSAHGSFKETGAKDAVRMAVEEAFSD